MSTERRRKPVSARRPGAATPRVHHDPGLEPGNPLNEMLQSIPIGQRAQALANLENVVTAYLQGGHGAARKAALAMLKAQSASTPQRRRL